MKDGYVILSLQTCCRKISEKQKQKICINTCCRDNNINVEIQSQRNRKMFDKQTVAKNNNYSKLSKQKKKKEF